MLRNDGKKYRENPSLYHGVMYQDELMDRTHSYIPCCAIAIDHPFNNPTYISTTMVIYDILPSIQFSNLLLCKCDLNILMTI